MGKGGDFTPLGHVITSGDIFDCHTLGSVTGIEWIEASDTVKYPTITRTAPHTPKSYPAPNVNSACSRSLGATSEETQTKVQIVQHSISISWLQLTFPTLSFTTASKDACVHPFWLLGLF